MPTPPHQHLPAVTVGVLGVVVLAVVGVATATPTLPVYLLVTGAGAAVVGWLLWRHTLSRAVVWGLVAFGVGNLAGGVVPVGDGVLYGWWLWEPVVRYDNLQHAVGFGAVGRAGWELLRPRLGLVADEGPVLGLLIVAIGATMGSVNEIVEWVMTLTIPDVDIGGYDNTVRDLVANLVGAMGWAAGTRLGQRP